MDHEKIQIIKLVNSRSIDFADIMEVNQLKQIKDAIVEYIEEMGKIKK